MVELSSNTEQANERSVRDEQTDVRLFADAWDSIRTAGGSESRNTSSLEPTQLVFTNEIFASKQSRTLPWMPESCPGDDPGGWWGGAHNLVEKTDANFDKIDSNQDGAISEDELNAAMNDCSFEKFDRRLMGLLIDDFDAFGDMKEDGEGISKADMEEVKRLLGNFELSIMLSYLDQSDVTAMDSDGDGQITKIELNDYMNAEPLFWRKELLEDILKNFDEFQAKIQSDSHKEGLSVESFEKALFVAELAHTMSLE